MRIDKFVWAARFYKTRSIGAEAIRTGQVRVNGENAKPAHTVKPGDVVTVKRNPIWRSYRVKELLKTRVGAALLAQYIEEVTPAEELEKLEMMKLVPGFDRDKGAGRPTKKERRQLDELEW
jgi:ribosome-associated heat shock protein Hsp15